MMQCEWQLGVARRAKSYLDMPICSYLVVKHLSKLIAAAS